MALRAVYERDNTPSSGDYSSDLDNGVIITIENNTLTLTLSPMVQLQIGLDILRLQPDGDKLYQTLVDLIEERIELDWRDWRQAIVRKLSTALREKIRAPA